MSFNVYYSPEYAGAAHSFSTTRKAKWIAESLIAEPIYGLKIRKPTLASDCELELAHSRPYIKAVKTGEPVGLAESQGFSWDPGLWESVLYSTSGVVCAALDAMNRQWVAGSLSSGLHHARRDRGAAFCTLNGLAIAAKVLLSNGVRSVLILDFDAHCGGGTAEIIAGDDRIKQIDVSVSSFDCYESTEQSQLTIAKSNYLKMVRFALKQAGEINPELVLYNAGMDVHEDCSIGGQKGIDTRVIALRERYVFEYFRSRKISVAFVLAGGYESSGRLSQAGLVQLHRLTMEAASKHV
jgi:acetoin utilization deacetylase AcuC-like enzyme